MDEPKLIAEKDWLGWSMEQREAYTFRLLTAIRYDMDQIRDEVRSLRGVRFIVNSSLAFAGSIIGGFAGIIALCKLGLFRVIQ